MSGVVNLIAVRGRDKNLTSCCGCGKDHYVYYEILGRYDLPDMPHNFSTYLCFKCYRPLRSKIELIDKVPSISTVEKE